MSSANLPPSAILNNTLSATAFRVLLYLAQNTSEARTLSISQQEVADALGTKLRDVQQAFLQIQEEGFIEWKNKGSRVKTVVRLLWASPEASVSQANIPTQALSRAAIEAAAAASGSNGAIAVPSLPDGTARFVPPLPGILARIDLLEEQNDALIRQNRDLHKRLDQQARHLHDLANHLKLTLSAEATPTTSPTMRRVAARVVKGKS